MLNGPLRRGLPNLIRKFDTLFTHTVRPPWNTFVARGHFVTTSREGTREIETREGESQRNERVTITMLNILVGS